MNEADVYLPNFRVKRIYVCEKNNVTMKTLPRETISITCCTSVCDISSPWKHLGTKGFLKLCAFEVKINGASHSIHSAYENNHGLTTRIKSVQ